MPSRLEQLLSKALKAQGAWDKPLQEARKYPVKTVKEAELVCKVLEKLVHFQDEGTGPERAPQPERSAQPAWKQALYFFQAAESKRALRILAEKGLPILYYLYDRGRGQAATNPALQHDLDLLLKLFVLFGEPAGIQRMVQAAQAGLNADGLLWSAIFHELGNNHPAQDEVIEKLSSPLPPRFIGVAFLDWANHLAIAGRVRRHPFDSPEGKQRLQDWLAASNPQEFSYAHSATAALPFISNPERDQLLALAMDHQNEAVQMEAAWASGRLGSESGLKMLGRFCLNLTTAKRALNYLEELERPDRIPSDALDPDFQAKAEMCAWLMHPNEFGRQPDELELVDKREMYWPPTDDERTLWLFRYGYHATEKGKDADAGLGMVGSVTFALFGETTIDLDPLDAYALHCCWELEMKRDRRAPRRRTIAAGRKILREYNE